MVNCLYMIEKYKQSLDYFLMLYLYYNGSKLMIYMNTV